MVKIDAVRSRRIQLAGIIIPPIPCQTGTTSQTWQHITIVVIIQVAVGSALAIAGGRVGIETAAGAEELARYVQPEPDGGGEPVGGIQIDALQHYGFIRPRGGCGFIY